jgi:hypothetical protein
MFTTPIRPRLRFAVAPIAAVDNLTLLAVMASGDPGTKPGPAAKAFYHETVDAAFRNPTTRNSFLNNAWQLFSPYWSNPREWEGYTDRLATRRTEFGATSIVVDAHGIPTAVQANPNDAQNDLRFKKFRPAYRQSAIGLARDEYIPITVDPIQVGRLLAQGANGDAAAKFMAAQLTQMLNTDKAREFNTLWDSFARFIGQPGIFYTHTGDLNPQTITPAQAIAAAVTIRAAVRNLADFTNRYSTAKQIQTVPIEQVELVISVSAMQALGLGYTGAFNTEYALALPADQIVEVPDQYFLSRPEFAGLQVQWAIVDKGTDQGDGGTFVVVDSLYEQGADPYVITSTTNQALHHAEFLDLNPYKTLIIGGPGTGTQIISEVITPTAITLDVYTDQGVIAPGGNLPRGVEFSTLVKPTDASGAPAGGYVVTITGSDSPTGSTAILRYMDGKIGNDDQAATVTVTATSLVDPSVTVSHTYDLTGPVIDLANGQQYVDPFNFPGVFAPGSGSGGTYTYTPDTGVVYEKSATETGARTPLGASPVAVPTGTTIWVHATAASGYVLPDGSTVAIDGPHTAA